MFAKILMKNFSEIVIPIPILLFSRPRKFMYRFDVMRKFSTRNLGNTIFMY